jgi:hypothetical protein
MAPQNLGFITDSISIACETSCTDVAGRSTRNFAGCVSSVGFVSEEERSGEKLIDAIQLTIQKLISR